MYNNDVQYKNIIMEGNDEKMEGLRAGSVLDCIRFFNKRDSKVSGDESAFERREI